MFVYQELRAAGIQLLAEGAADWNKPVRPELADDMDNEVNVPFDAHEGLPRSPVYREAILNTLKQCISEPPEYLLEQVQEEPAEGDKDKDNKKGDGQDNDEDMEGDGGGDGEDNGEGEVGYVDLTSAPKTDKALIAAVKDIYSEKGICQLTAAGAFLKIWKCTQ